MGVIKEKDLWPEEIYRIQNSDPIVGGEDGIINIQPEQVANRTCWLKNGLLQEHDEEGKHALTDENIADDAGIPESMLNLSVSTSELKNGLDTVTEFVNQLQADVLTIIGENGLLTKELAQIARLNWRYGLWGAEFEFFTDGLTMRDAANIDARAVIGRDDSIDCANTSGLRPGMRLLVSDGNFREEVEIRSVLDRGRIRLVHDLSRTYDDPAILGYTDWDLSNAGLAVVSKGQVFYSRFMDTLASCGIGKLLICHKKDSGSVSVKCRETGAYTEWEDVPLTRSLSCENPDFIYDEYDISGARIQLKITGADDNPVIIKHMALLPAPFNFLHSSIRTPHLIAPDPLIEIWQDLFPVASSRFFTAYRDYYVQTEYGFFIPGTDSPIKVVDIRKRGLVVLEDIKNMPEAGIYEMRCRHQSDLGEWSLWSDPVTVNLQAMRILFGFEGSKKSRGFGQAPLQRLGTYPVRFGFLGAKMSGGFDSDKIIFTTKLTD